MMTGITTNLDFAPDVITIIFDRPRRKNAITQMMMNDVIGELNRCAADDNVKVVVLTGAGDFYSSGADFFGADEINPSATLRTFEQFVATLIDFPKPVVAVVPGPAIGMACTTLALCDIVYASDQAYFQTPFTQLGLVPEGCSTYTFPRTFGVAKCVSKPVKSNPNHDTFRIEKKISLAAKLLYLNEVMSVQEAAQSGFVTQIFPHKELRKKSLVLIKELASLPLQSLMLSKELVRGWDRRALHSANAQEVKLLATRFQSRDFIKAMTDPETFNKIKSKL